MDIKNTINEEELAKKAELRELRKNIHLICSLQNRLKKSPENFSQVGIFMELIIFLEIFANIETSQQVDPSKYKEALKQADFSDEISKHVYKASISFGFYKKYPKSPHGYLEKARKELAIAFEKLEIKRAYYACGEQTPPRYAVHIRNTRKKDYQKQGLISPTLH